MGWYGQCSYWHINSIFKTGLISCKGINFEGGRVKRQIEHKIFGQLGYQWKSAIGTHIVYWAVNIILQKKCDLHIPFQLGDLAPGRSFFLRFNKII